MVKTVSTPKSVFLEWFEAWRERRWDNLVALAQPSSIQWIRDVPYEDLKILRAFAAEHGMDAVLPHTKGANSEDWIRAREAIRDLEQKLDAGDVGNPYLYVAENMNPFRPSAIEREVRILDCPNLKPDFAQDVLARIVAQPFPITVNVRMIRENGSWGWNPQSFKRWKRTT